MAIYAYSYSFRDKNGGLHYDAQITRRHPLLIVKDWHDQYDGNNGSQLLWYHRIGDEQLGDLELQQYLDYSLSENAGELGHGG